MADKITQVYNAYKADGATRAKSEQQFRNWMYGDNYRRGVWNDLRKQGASVGTFEHFTEALGYRMNPKVKSKVAKQAIQYGAPKVPDNWGQMDTGRVFANDEMEQQLDTQRNNQASSNAKKTGSDEPIVQRAKEKVNRTHLKKASKSGAIMNPLTGEPINNVPAYREKKEGKYWNPITETDMGDAVLDWSTTDANGDKVAQTQTKQNFEADAAAKALIRSYSQSKHDKDFEDFGNRFDERLSQEKGARKDDWGKLFDRESWSNMPEFGDGEKARIFGSDDTSFQKVYNKYGPKMASEKDFKEFLQSHSAEIAQMAGSVNMTPEGFVDRYVAPNFNSIDEEEYRNSAKKYFTPKGVKDMIVQGLLTSGEANMLHITPESYQELRNEAISDYQEDNSNKLYDKGVFSEEGLSALGKNIVTGGAQIAPSAAGFALAGAEAKGVVKGLEMGWKALRGTGLATKVLGKAVPKTLASLTEKYGAQTAGRILNAVNNESIGSFIQANARQFAQGSLTMGVFEANNYLATEGREKIKEGKWGELAEGLYTSGMSGLGTGMLFSGIGTVTGALGRNLGVTGREATRLEKLKHGTEKALFSASALFVEGLGFRAEDLYDEAKKGELTFGSVLENGGKGVIDKITMDLGMAAGKGKRPSLKQMVVGAVANTNPHVKFSAVEKNELMKSTGGKSLFEALDGIAEGKNVSPVYRTEMSEFFNDPNISRRTKQKVAYVVGKTIDTNMPRTERVSVSQGALGTQEVRTYSKDGELLTVDVYKNADAAEVAKQEIYAKRDKDDFITLWVDSLKPTQSENNTALENTVKELGYDDVGVFLADWDEAQKSGDADFLSKVSKTINENVGKIVADRHKQMLDVKRAINEEYDVDIDKVLDKKPVMWKDKEREAVKELGNRLKKGFSDKNDEAQNNAVARQDGADLSEQTELEDSEKVIESSQAVNERLGSATEAWQKIQDENPDLTEWMKNNPDATVEDIRENFGDYVADAYMELSNAKAMRDGFIQNTGEKIEDAVRNQVGQAKFTGTMQDKEGVKVVTDNSVTVFADKDGNEYTLIGGDVIVDSAGDGSYSAGKSGLVIFRDKDGNLVQRTNFDGLNEVGTFSLEDYANRIRTTLQEQKTAEIQSTETLLPESQKKETPKEEIKPEPTVGSSTSTDTIGVNHGLNEGATVTSGNSPMISDGKDTTKSSDLQEGNETLTVKEGAEAPKNYELNDIPMDNEGEPVYEQVPKERTAQDLFDKLGDGNVAHDYAQIRIEGAEKELKEAKKKEPKIGAKINEYLKKKQEYEDRVKAAEDKVAYWESVKDEIEKLTHTTPEELKEAQEELDGTAAREEYKKTVGEAQPADGVSLAAEFVVDARITPESFRKETGLSAADQRTFVGMIASAEKGGKSIERLGEELVEYDNAYYGGAYFHGDSNDARSAIISALMSAKSRKGLREMAQPDMEREVRERARMRDEAYHERYGMDYEEYLSYSEQEMPHILGKLNNFDEQKYLQDKAEEITNQINKEHGKTDRENDSSREESVHGAGDKVLPEERIDDRGRGESPKEHGGREKAERRGNTEDAPLHETPSGGEVEKGERKEEKPSDPSDAAEGMRGAAEQFHEERVEKARKAYEEAKASGDASETKRTKDEYRKALDDKLKAQGIGLVERRKTIAKEMGEEPKVEKPKGEGPKVGEKQWEDMTPTERAEKADADPLTEDEIRSDEDNKELAAAAIAYLNGDKSLLNQIAYLKIYGNVRSRHEDVPGNSGTEDKTQLAAADNGGGEGMELESGRGSGGTVEPMDRGAGGEAAPGKQEGGETGKGDTDTPAGEGSNSEGEGGTPGLGGLPSGSGRRTGSGTAGSTGSVGSGRGRGSGSRPSKSNGKRKPAAKQGTSFPNSKGRDVKQETKDAKAAMMAAFAEFKKRGKNGSVSISLVGLNNEQIEYLPEMAKATGRYGIALIGEGIYRAKEWIRNVREAITDQMKDCGFSDTDIDEYIREMWHMPWEMDGETHKIGEWASIKGYAGLRESLKEPLRKKFDKQVLAEPTEVKVGDRKNIEETLPFLLPQQQDDVLKAETQFFDESHKDKAHANGKGYMFTNGTGTGKTYTGLGIIKRMVKQGKGRILIITPSQQKVKDWISDGKNLCLDIRDLDDWANERGSTATNEKGDGVVITTFANFGTNKRLLEDQFDAIVYDESHRIMENKNATETARSRQHYMLSNRNESYALMRLEEINPDCMKMRGLAEDFEDARKKEVERIQAEYRKEHPSENEKEMRFHTSKSLPKDIHSFSISDKAKFPELGKIYEDYIKARDHYINNVKPKLEKQAKESVDKTKVVFLSATPFNTRENIEYAEGYLFSYPERNDMGQSGKTQFFLEHFGAGYKYRYHRLESSTSNAEALAKQEIAFSDWLQNDLGTMSGRVIDSPFDYSRDFPTVSVEHADEFNTACEEISRDKIFGDAYRKVLGDYNYGSALFETMKVSALLPRLREHLAAGRKIVIFHRRVTSKEPLKAPFGMILGEQAEQTIKALPKEKQPEARIHLNELRDKYSGLLEWEKTLDFSMPREQLAKAFGEDNILYFSGSESKSVKSEAVKQFNDDNSGKNIIVIQEASGKEGISLHDTTGKHQRVCITLALPQSPITALQIEGRTYRIGNESNAIFEYPVLGLTSEYNLFASKFNRQVSTTENLALGSQARNLRDSFARGIEEHSGIVPIDQQGVGGKEFDKGDVSENDPFDNAVLDYYTNQRLNKNNREGVDYFPTPEPLGYKMVEWANIGEGDSVLEPSAGHGAIARYVPQSNELVAIEPSMSLFAKLQMKAGGLGRKFQNETFEAYHISNKHDTIVMNPPFGHAGATAIAHIEKAFGHLEEGGRMVAIIPRGAMDAKFVKWAESNKSVAPRAYISLPDVTFQQAGTKVNCRVVVVDKITDAKLREKADITHVDLNRHYDKIEDFFNDLRGVEVPDRIIDTNFKMQKMSKSAVKSLKEIRDVWSADVDKDGVHVRISSWMGYDISFTGSEDPKRWKDKMAATYDKYAQMEKAELREGNKAVFGELKELACKLAGMTEDEMRRYLVSKGTGGVRFRTDEDQTPEERRSEKRMEEHHVEVAKAAENLNTKVNVCVDINDVTNAEARSAIERGEKVKAWYDTRTGEVHVYLPNVTDKYDAQMSVAHEVVAHKGMRGLLGEEGYRSMMRRMYTHLSNEEVKEVNERMMRNGWDFYTAMDEWVADKAEESVFTPKYVVMKDGLHRNPLDKVFHIVTEALHNVGYRINPNVDDVKYWLWESKKGLKNGDAYTAMKRNSFLWRLNHNTSNDGIENGEFVETGGVRFSNGNSKLNGEDSEKLFVSLQNKKGKEYYDTVTEIARRVSDGRARFTRLPEEYERRGVLSVPHAAARIIASAWVRDTERSSRNTASSSWGDNHGINELGENREESAMSQIEGWAKRNKCWINEDDYISKGYKDNRNGSESVVYFVGDKVVKFANPQAHFSIEGLNGFLDNVILMNIADPEAESKIIGFSRDSNGKFRVVLEQKKYAKTFEYEMDKYGEVTSKGKEIYNEWVESIPEIEQQFARRGIEYDPETLEATCNGIVISDLWSGNIACDENGIFHIIDGNTTLVSKDKAQATVKPIIIDKSSSIRFRKGGNNMSDEQSRESTLFRKPSLDRSKNDTPLMSATKDSIDKALNNWNARRIECWTDDKHGLRVFQQELAKGLKKGMNDSMDSYHGAINQSSIVREKQYQFETRELKTMNDAVKECTRKLGGGMEGYEELNKYAYVKSGLERNRVLFVRDAAEQVDKKIMKLNKEALDKDPQAATLAKMGVEEFRDAFHSEKKFQETLLNSGKISLAEYYKALDDFIKDFSFQHTGDAEKDALIDKLNDWYADKVGGKYDENENDYSGIRKFDDFDSDAERIDYVMNTEVTLGEESKNKLWRGIGGVTHFAIDNDYNYGVISKDVHNRVSSMFSWYIPMRGFKEDTMEDMYAYLNNEISDGGNVSSVVKRADGRTTLADSPLGTAAALAERSISNGEDNRNKQRLYRLVNQWLKDHTTTNEGGKIELTEEAPAMISEVWYKKVTDHTTGETYWEAVMPDIDGEKDPKQIRAKVERFEENMRNAEKNGNATRTLQKGTFAKPFKVAKHKNEHVVFVNVNGKQKMIIMQGNPRPAQAINGDTASDVTAGRLMRGMSAMFTSYNITFSVTNTSRDTFFANNNVAIREDAAYYARFVKNQALMGGSMLQGTVMMNMPKVKGMYYQLWSDYKKGKKLTGKYGKYFEEYMNNGGKTGFVQTKTIEDLEKHIRNEATQKMLSASTLGKVMSKVPEVIEALNERSENMNRFACYVTSREMGRSVMRSVSDAKEVSTNFNRKGSGSKAFKGTNAKAWEKWQGWLYDRAKRYYLFFNAGMQSLSVQSNNFVRHKVKTAAFAVGIPILFASSIIPALNSWIASCCDEDDQYDNLSEWERRNNICIYAGHSNWVKVPLPIELRAFYGFGDIALGLTNPAFRSEKGLWLDMLSQMTQILPVDFMGEGGDFGGALMPDVAKPLYHVWVNRDWTGKPIYKDYDYLKYEPEYQKVFQGENEWFVSFSKFINEMSGGNEHVKGSLDGKWNNPAIWGEIITGYGGGALSDAIRTGKLATRVATWNWEDFSTREVPMVRALYSSATEKTKYYRSLSKYAHYKEDADKYLHDFKANLKSDNPLYVMKAISDMKRESPEFVRMVKIHGFEKSIKDLKKIANNEKIPKKARDEAKELINQEKVKLVKEFESDE